MIMYCMVAPELQKAIISIWSYQAPLKNMMGGERFFWHKEQCTFLNPKISCLDRRSIWPLRDCHDPCACPNTMLDGWHAHACRLRSRLGLGFGIDRGSSNPVHRNPGGFLIKVLEKGTMRDLQKFCRSHRSRKGRPQKSECAQLVVAQGSNR